MATERDTSTNISTNSVEFSIFGGYPVEIFDINVDHKFICSHCKKVLKDPLQSYCGHRFCRICCEDLLREARCAVCPDCREEQMTDAESVMLNEHQIFPDNAIRREMSRLETKCVYLSCTWTGTFKDFEAQHWDACPHRLHTCSACGTVVCQDSLQQHQEAECSKRNVRCEHCVSEISAGLKDQHDCESRSYPMPCEECDMRDIPRHKMKEHSENECPNRTVCCPMGCVGQIRLDALYDHLSENAGKHLAWLTDKTSCLEQHLQTVLHLHQPPPTSSGVGLDSATSAITCLEQKVTELSRQVDELADGDLLRQQVTDTADRVNMMDQVMPVLHHEIEQILHSLTQIESRAHTDRLRHQQLSSTVDELGASVRALECASAAKDAAMADLELRLQAAELVRFDGTLLWRIPNFDRKRRDAVSGKATSIYSPAFFTGVNGYKMCARIYPNGDGMGKNSHLSLFFVLMRGSYDSLLPWPFLQKVTLMLVDQMYREHVVNAFRPDPASSSFKRPSTEMNVASGCPVFIPLAKLTDAQHGYLKDNTLFIKIVVDSDGLDMYADFTPQKGAFPCVAPPQ